MTTNDADLPLDYKWVDWDHLYTYVGRALIGDHVPLMTGKVAKYLQDQARQMRRHADKLERAATIMLQTTQTGPPVTVTPKADA